MPAGRGARRIQCLNATGIHLVVLLKTLGAILGLSMVLPLYLWGATGNLRASFSAWWSWCRYMAAATALVGGAAVVTFLVERIG